MGALRQQAAMDRQRGALLIEVMVTVVIVVIALLALLKLQTRLQSSEMEAYQRTQAIMLVNDMASRLETNRLNAADYVTADPLGAGMDCSDIGTDDLQQSDSTEWCLALQGAGEKMAADDSSVGAMIAGRGCVAATDATNTEFMVSVVWQGLAGIAAPPASVTCGANLYDTAGTECVSDLCRRYVTTIVRIADL